MVEVGARKKTKSIIGAVHYCCTSPRQAREERECVFNGGGRQSTTGSGVPAAVLSRTSTNATYGAGWTVRKALAEIAKKVLNFAYHIPDA